MEEKHADQRGASSGEPGSKASARQKTQTSFSALSRANMQSSRVASTEALSRQKQRIIGYSAGGKTSEQLLTHALTSSQTKMAGDRSPKAKLDSLQPAEIYFWQNSDTETVGMKKPKHSKYLGAIQVNIEKEREKTTTKGKGGPGKTSALATSRPLVHTKIGAASLSKIPNTSRK